MQLRDSVRDYLMRMRLSQTRAKTETEIGTERFCKGQTHKNETVSQVGPKTESEIGIERGCKEQTHKNETVSQVGAKTESEIATERL
ncbi:MAG: hypothetical protein ACK559_10175, partial [bacterium]